MTTKTTTPKNEYKGKAYIKCKHMIDNASPKTIEATQEFVNLWAKNSKADVFDKAAILVMLSNKLNELVIF